MKKDRKSSLELLRILSMFLIVMHHYSVHGGFNLNDQSLTLNKVIVQILSLGGKLGVNIFVLITGYFLIKSNFKLKKLLILLGQVYFYSIGIFLIFTGLGIANFSLKKFIQACLPITYNSYWFVSIYVVMYIFSPYINSFINSLSRENLFKFILIDLFLWCIIPTFLKVEIAFSQLAWFITLYSIGAYCRLYPNKYILNFKFNLNLSILMYSLTIASVIIFDLIGIKIKSIGNNATYFMSGNKLLISICSISLFLTFKNLNIKTNKLINTISSTTFGIYLIHDNNYVKPFLWRTILHNYSYLNSKYLILHAILCITLVFIICSFIDYLRMKLIEKPILKLLYKYKDKLDVIKQQFDLFLNKIINKFNEQSNNRLLY